jgi:hypothetical protein
VALSPVASFSKTFWCFSVLINHFVPDPLSELEELTDEYTHYLLLEGCKLYFELTKSCTRPIDVFYCYDIFLDGDAQDRELDLL